MCRAAILAALVLLLAGCAGTPSPTGLTFVSFSVSPPASQEPAEPLRYVALGDSYTIGTGLPRQADRWPNQLVRALRPEVPLRLVENLAVQWHTTSEVIDLQLPVLEELAPVDFVSLLIGVNDVIGDATDDEYRANLQVILDGRERADSLKPIPGILDVVPADHVLLITTPDYTLAPDQPYHRPGDQATIARFNQILREEAAARGIAVVDIAPISDLVPQDPTLIADDGVHPSAKQFAGWVELIAPVVRRLMSDAGTPGSSEPPEPSALEAPVGGMMTAAPSPALQP